jgi:hypothetical protein
VRKAPAKSQVLFKTAKVVKNKKNLRNYDSQDESKGI